MNILISGLGVLIVVILIYMTYRWFAFRRESKEISELRFKRIQPLLEKIDNNEIIIEAEILEYAKDLKTREILFQILSERDLKEKFPAEYLSVIMGAESNLANWLEFPTELNKTPDEIEHVERVVINYQDNDVIYHVFKFRVDKPHWASEEGWILGVVGPYFNDSEPYDFPSSTFSRLTSKFGEVKPVIEATWVHENISMR